MRLVGWLIERDHLGQQPMSSVHLRIHMYDRWDVLLALHPKGYWESQTWRICI